MIILIKTSKQINVPVLGLHILVRFGGKARSLIQKVDPDYPWNRKSTTKMQICRMRYARFWSSFPPRMVPMHTTMVLQLQLQLQLQQQHQLQQQKIDCAIW